MFLYALLFGQLLAILIYSFKRLVVGPSMPLRDSGKSQWNKNIWSNWQGPIRIVSNSIDLFTRSSWLSVTDLVNSHVNSYRVNEALLRIYSLN